MICKRCALKYIGLFLLFAGFFTAFQYPTIQSRLALAFGATPLERAEAMVSRLATSSADGEGAIVQALAEMRAIVADGMVYVEDDSDTLNKLRADSTEIDLAYSQSTCRDSGGYCQAISRKTALQLATNLKDDLQSYQRTRPDPFRPSHR